MLGRMQGVSECQISSLGSGGAGCSRAVPTILTLAVGVWRGADSGGFETLPYGIVMGAGALGVGALTKVGRRLALLALAD